MSSLLSSQGMALATAMAVSGTVILFALCRNKPLSTAQFVVDHNSTTRSRTLRSCISPSGKKRDKKKKRVHFADDVGRPITDNEEIRLDDHVFYYDDDDDDDDEGQVWMLEDEELEHEQVWVPADRNFGSMPANRMALYNGILQDRSQRMACSY